MDNNYIKGRGAQINTMNPFEKREWLENEDLQPDDEIIPDTRTEFFYEHAKKIVNKVVSPDIGLGFSMNPYQGCEHGCIYCYARNTHHYWGFSAGLDFETKIMIKENAPELLRKTFDNPRWQPSPIMLSGNTDCYQPAERKLKITRRILEVCMEYRHPVGIITKNSLVLRDIDILEALNALNLIHVNISITSLDEDLRQKLEPRTTTAKQRLRAVEVLSAKNIPVNIMIAPIIPSINDHEIPEIIKAAAERGAVSAAYTIVRLNGAVAEIFEDWVRKNYPDRADKVLNQIAACHGGNLNDSRFGTRMKGEGVIAETIRNLYIMAKKKYLKDRVNPAFDLSHFRRPSKGGQLSLF